MPKSNPNHITTLIGDGCEFEGNMSSSSSTRIDGKLKGRITGENSIVVGETGLVLGEIKASETVVYGKVEGTIETNSLEIKRSGIVLGDIFIESLIVEDGGIYNGRCTMNEITENISIETSEGTKKELSSNTFEIKG
ncbi:MAG: polymer-forming cytoskeletal protein [Deltaproteobacteria bacterium]|nr:polymer-forming cytoskeletal protein [Deltaproteobacteria bacterium]